MKSTIPEANFTDVFEQIVYDWGYDNRNLFRDDKGNFVINKTYITPTGMSYKMEQWVLKPGTFEKLVKLQEMFDE